jgi:hypothetical protein
VLVVGILWHDVHVIGVVEVHTGAAVGWPTVPNAPWQYTVEHEGVVEFES